MCIKDKGTYISEYTSKFNKMYICTFYINTIIICISLNIYYNIIYNDIVWYRNNYKILKRFIKIKKKQIINIHINI